MLSKGTKKLTIVKTDEMTRRTEQEKPRYASCLTGAPEGENRKKKKQY
jgi:hypothetical protein